MKIIHICNANTAANGIYQVLINLSKNQSQLGHEISVFNLSKVAEASDDIKKRNSGEVIKAISASKPDLVIFHGVYYRGIIDISNYLRKNKIPYLIELHGALSSQNLKKSRIKKEIYKAFFLNKIIKKAKAIIYLNKNEKLNSTINKINPNYLIIPNGCNQPEEKLQPTRIKNHGIINLIFMGRIFRDHKGLDILVDSMKALYKDGYVKYFHFDFYGLGERQEVEFLNDALVQMPGFGSYHGATYGENKVNAFKKADIFILASRYEGFPIAILEALSYGLPCIITPQTNVADIINTSKCGWVTDLDSESIAETIVKAREEYLEKSITLKQNAKNVSLEYSWDKIAEESILKYEQALSN